MDAGDGCGGWCLDRYRAVSDWIAGDVTTPSVGPRGIDARETRPETYIPTGRIRFRSPEVWNPTSGGRTQEIPGVTVIRSLDSAPSGLFVGNRPGFLVDYRSASFRVILPSLTIS
jgi:hypothetical protein